MNRLSLNRLGPLTDEEKDELVQEFWKKVRALREEKRLAKEFLDEKNKIQ